MENNEVEVLVQEFNGRKYFLCNTVRDELLTYDVYSGVEDPEDIIIAKNISTAKGDFYEILSDENEIIKVLSLCDNN